MTVHRLRGRKTALRDTQDAQYSFDREGKQIVLVGRSRAAQPEPGIDGFDMHTGEPIQLRRVDSDVIGKIVARANKALTTAQGKYTDVEVYIRTPENHTRNEVIDRWTNTKVQRQPLPDVDGTIHKYVVYCKDGALEILPLPDGTFQLNHREPDE